MLKATNWKKEAFRIFVVLVIGFAYEYQKPIMATEKATDYAALCLQNPPERLGIEAMDMNWPDIKPEKFSIDEKSGFFNQITNKRELNITLKTKNGEERTVKMDAYTGRCLEVTGPIN
ncbi:hypothetical protein [Bacillus sp. FJAT-29814]|uniref:hypothetical protein n=1 Tax=Bacillus sp. FJAT-29814 TaxID=1729688 RepID=UPI000833CCD8|nr:hypothetical protein [Bacillus sp. FJAT-29814]